MKTVVARVLVWGVMGCLTLGFAPGGAAWAQPPPSHQEGGGPYDESPISVSPDTPAPGAPVRVTASGFASNSSVTVTMFSTPVQLGTAPADANGDLTAQVVVPTGAGFASGSSHMIQVTGLSRSGAPMSLSAQLTLGGSNGPGLPFTGGDFAPLVAVAAVLLMVGGAVLLGVRRRAGAHD